MSINFYIARRTYCLIFMYSYGLKVDIKRICYVMVDISKGMSHTKVLHESRFGIKEATKQPKLTGTMHKCGC